MNAALLLDTHVILWLAADSRKLGPTTREALKSANKAYFSAASVWEAAIKVGTGKLHAPPNITGLATRSYLAELPVLAHHAGALSDIGLRLSHRDPFDAVLVTQAAVEDLTLLTADRKILDAALCSTIDATT